MDFSATFAATFAATWGRASVGMEAPPVRVEAHITGGLPSFNIVGLAETAVRESRERVRSAILNSSFDYPKDRRITVNLAPADLPKTGGRFDLAIAMAVLGASRQLAAERLDGLEFLAELSLEGHLRPVRGALIAAAAAGKVARPIIVARGNSLEAALPEQARAFPAACLTDVVKHLLASPALAQAPRLLTTVASHGGSLASAAGPQAVQAQGEGAALGDALKDMERAAIRKALEQTRYNKTAAARLLGMSFRSLRYRIKKLGLE
jgi:magnesium chelatase family protein